MYARLLYGPHAIFRRSMYLHYAQDQNSHNVYKLR